MNTKGSTETCAGNFYDGIDGTEGGGGDGPGALLDMLAEVASRTLRSESGHAGVSVEKDEGLEEPPPLMPPPTPPPPTPGDENLDARRNLARVLAMSPGQLVKRFALFSGDELKKRYSYECTMTPACRQKYTSFASENRARISIMTHLTRHLECLRRDDEQPSLDQMCKSEVKDINSELEGAIMGQSLVSCPRRILSDTMGFKEFQREREDRAREGRRRKERVAKVPSDHSYYERTEDEGSVDAAIDEAMSENIMLMVVESDRVRIEELASRDTSVDTTEELVDDAQQRSVFKEETVAVAMAPPPPVPPAKPKGRAKFIGTSKEEREMALLLMERIKKRGNPSGSNLQCRICDPPRSFTAPTTLVSHYRSHAGIKPYECRICRSVFTRRHSLKYHMLIHQNQTRFTCADCGKKFRHPSHFREHRRRHTGESPFGCEDCGQRFKTRNTYKRHLKTRHGKVLTTSGELLCLTEEEFEKVQTNRRRKTRSVSIDPMAVAAMEEDSKATSVIIANYRTDHRENDVTAIFENDRIFCDVTIGGEEEDDDNDEDDDDDDDDEDGDEDDDDDDDDRRPIVQMLNQVTDSIDGPEYANVRFEYGDPLTINENNVEDREVIVTYDESPAMEYYETADSSSVCHATIGATIIPTTTNNNNNNEEDAVAIFEGEMGDADKQPETMTLQVAEKSTFIVLTNNDFKTNYVRIGSEGVIVAQK